MHTTSPQTPLLSIVVPALNEEDNIEPLVDQIAQVLKVANLEAELIIVDDGSHDETLNRLRGLASRHSFLRVLHRDRPQGQSAAMYAGIQAARGRWIATLDADLQNDPADLPRMLQLAQETGADFVQGDRSASRADSWQRKLASWIGRVYRRLLLGDRVRDTGCTARLVRAEFYRQVPLQFYGMHRFIPAYCARLGAKIVEMPVHHRPRRAGQTKYRTFRRGLRGFFDGLAVRWMFSRLRPTEAKELFIENAADKNMPATPGS